MCRAIVIDRFYDGAEREIALAPGMTVREALAEVHRQYPEFFTAQDEPLPAFPDGVRFRLPTAVIANEDGEPAYVRQARWNERRLKVGETLALVAMPRGGGSSSSTGKQVASVIALIALTIAAPYVAAAVGFGSIAASGAVTLTLAGRLVATGIVMGGAALLQAATPKPNSPQTQEQKVYTAAAAGNSMSPLGVVPVRYGRERNPPPFATRPWIEYENNDQYIHQVLAVTLGEYEHEQIDFGDTEAWSAADGYSDSFDDLEFEFVEPGGQITLFPAGVVVSGDVSGIEVQDPPDVLGPFTVNGPGEENLINKIAVDLVFPAGIFESQADGAIGAWAADIKGEYRKIDDSGDPDGDWVVFIQGSDPFDTGTDGAKRYWGASKEPLRFTEKVSVATGRYEVKIYATFPFASTVNANAENRCLWSGLKGYLADFTTPDGVSLLACKIKANEDFNQVASNQIFVLGTRKLPVYDPETGTWSEPVATRSIAWAVADILRDQDYGGGIADGKIDLAWLAAYDTFWDGRGDYFDGTLDRSFTLIDAANAILRAGRSQVIRIGGRIGFVRDEARDVRRAHFTPGDIVKGSFWREVILADDETPTSIWAQFLNANTWQMQEVHAFISAYGTGAPVEDTYFGMTDRTHVWREAVTDVAKHAYRREFVGFTTEWSGRMLSRLDPILVSHPLMGTGSARIIALADGPGLISNILRLDRDIVQSPAPQYFDDEADFTASNNGSPGSVSTLTGTFVDDGTLDMRAVVVSGTAMQAIRHKAVVPVPKDVDQIFELQVTWLTVGAGEGRVRARLICLDEDFEAVGGTLGGYSDTASSGDGVQRSRFYFSTQDGTGIVGWDRVCKYLRFGVNGDQTESGITVHIGQIRVRPVYGTEDSVYIRSKTGKEWGPCLVDHIPDDRTIVLDTTDLAEIEGDDGEIVENLPEERAMDATVTLFQDSGVPFAGLVVSAIPQGGDRVEIIAVKDAAEVYTADGTSSPPPYLTPPKPPIPPDRPIVLGLFAFLTQSGFDLVLSAGWQHAAGARVYKAEVSYDEGVTWNRVYRDDANRFTAKVSEQALWLRVAAIGRFRGPWATFEITEVPQNVPPPNIIEIPHLNPDVQALLKQLQIESQAFLKASIDELSGWVEQLSALVADNTAYIATTEDSIISSVAKRTKEASAAITRLDRVAVEEGLARAEAIALLQASLEDLETAQSGTALLLQQTIVQVESNADGISALAQSVTTLLTIVNDGATGNSALAVAVSSLTNRVSITETSITSIAAATTALQSQVTALNGTVGGLSIAYENLETRVEVVEDAVTVEAIRNTLLNAEYRQFAPRTLWKGYSQLNAKGNGTGGTLASGQDDTLRLTASGTNAAYTFNLATADQFNGNSNRIVRLVGRWRSNVVDYSGRLYYTTASHGYSNSHFKTAPHPFGTGNVKLNQFVVLSFDMSSLDAGGNDWITNQITGIRFRPSTGDTSDFELWWIGWGSEDVAALGAVVESDVARAEKTEEGISAIASSLKSLIAETENGYAEGLIAFESVSAPSGVQSRIAIKAKTNINSVLTEAGLFIDVINSSTSRITMKAQQFVFVDNSGGNNTIPFYYDNGVLYIENARIKNLTANNISGGAITDPKVSVATNNLNINQDNTWTTLRTLSVTVDANTQMVLVDGAIYDTGLVAATNGGNASVYLELRIRRGSGTILALDQSTPVAITTPFGWSVSLMCIARELPPNGNHTYTLEARFVKVGDPLTQRQCTVRRRAMTSMSVKR